MTQVYVVKSTKEIKEIDSNSVVLPVSRTDGKKGKSGLGIVVPVVSENVVQVLLNDAIGKAWFVEQVDAVRSRIVSKLYKSNSTITSDRIGVSSILDSMRAEVESQRFTKESIEVWFKDVMVAVLLPRIQDKYPGIESTKSGKILNGYMESFQLLASRKNAAGRYEMADSIRNSLLKVLDYLPEDHEHNVTIEIAERLSNTEEPSNVLDSL
jgi:hypothetical protein